MCTEVSVDIIGGYKGRMCAHDVALDSPLPD